MHRAAVRSVNAYFVCFDVHVLNFFDGVRVKATNINVTIYKFLDTGLQFVQRFGILREQVEKIKVSI